MGKLGKAGELGELGEAGEAGEVEELGELGEAGEGKLSLLPRLRGLQLMRVLAGGVDLEEVYPSPTSFPELVVLPSA